MIPEEDIIKEMITNYHMMEKEDAATLTRSYFGGQLKAYATVLNVKHPTLDEAHKWLTEQGFTECPYNTEHTRCNLKEEVAKYETSWAKLREAYDKKSYE